ncbi:MAG TPA: hypothetical protein VE971_03830 [Candidatus Eisenbacteria bacterium]|nr:hypothetical protein [Candidatus Eisenbacteria bacterium]
MTEGFRMMADDETVDMDEQTRIDQENASEGTVDEDSTEVPEDEDSDIDEESEEEPTDKD